MASQNSPKEFGKIRSALWPIHSYELKKMIPMLSMFFFISFVYTILRDTKDTLIMTAPGSGAEAIPFLKLWCVVPAAIIIMLIFSKLSNTLDKERLFYTMVIPFIAFFGLFGFILYPMRDILHPTESAEFLRNLLPVNAATKGIIAIYANWTFAIFYILAEMWGSMVLSMLFWGFANDITKTSEAKRFYGLLGLGANFALIFSGRAIVWAGSGGEGRSYAFSLQLLMTAVVIAGLLTLVIYYWMNRVVLTDPRFYDVSQVKKKKTKTKMSIGESIRFLGKSKYIGCIAFIVLAYGISINLIEVIWKSQVKAQYPNPLDYNNFMGHFSECTGYATIFMILFVSHNVLRRFGWTIGALITPIVLTITGLLFLNFIVFREYMTGLLAMFGTTPLMMAVIFGAAQNIMSKSSKYSLFDPTKEMAYIPLDEESKVKGKAAIDVVGARLGKSGGSFVYQIAMLFVSTAVATAPFIAAVFIFIVGGWIYSVKALGKRYETLVKETEEEIVTSKASIASNASPSPSKS